MKLHNPGAEFFIPDQQPIDKALQRTTHIAIAAHQDDIEIMAYDGIIQCFGSTEEFFTGVVVTNGAGSPRDSLYKDYSDEEMQAVRKTEQKKAAYIGEYGAQALLDYPSSQVKDPNERAVIDEFKALLLATRPRIIYTHNLADKHDTHVGVTMHLVRALRELSGEYQPEAVYGCEVWRGLDWMNDDDKVVFDVDHHPNLASALVEVFDSQICGGKRYDMATIGRRLANATYAASHSTDTSSALIYGMDLTPLINDPTMDVIEYVTGYIQSFQNDVTARISKMQ